MLLHYHKEVVVRQKRLQVCGCERKRDLQKFWKVLEIKRIGKINSSFKGFIYLLINYTSKPEKARICKFPGDSVHCD